MSDPHELLDAIAAALPYSGAGRSEAAHVLERLHEAGWHIVSDEDDPIPTPRTAAVSEVRDDAGRFLGHEPRECGEHRTVGAHRAWCFDCQEWCYPSSPCVRCEIPGLRATAARAEQP